MWHNVLDIEGLDGEAIIGLTGVRAVGFSAVCSFDSLEGFPGGISPLAARKIGAKIFRS